MFNSQAAPRFPREPMPGQRLSYISPERLLSRKETGRRPHVNGITVNKTTQTVESAAAGGRYPAQWGGIRLRIDPVRDPAPLFRRLA